MKNSRILIAVLSVLLLLNIFKWVGNMKKGVSETSDIKLKNQIINFTDEIPAKYNSAGRNLFNAPRTERYSYSSSKNKTDKPVAEKKRDWPELKLSGTAINGGKKCAFLSGPGFSGAVYEGNDFLGGKYTLNRITDAGAEVYDKETGELKIYTKDGR